MRKLAAGLALAVVSACGSEADDARTETTVRALAAHVSGDWSRIRIDFDGEPPADLLVRPALAAWYEDPADGRAWTWVSTLANLPCVIDTFGFYSGESIPERYVDICANGPPFAFALEFELERGEHETSVDLVLGPQHHEDLRTYCEFGIDVDCDPGLSCTSRLQIHLIGTGLSPTEPSWVRADQWTMHVPERAALLDETIAISCPGGDD